MKTFYEVLQISETARAESVRTAYRHLAQRLHPDKNPDPGAAERFRAVHVAYVALIDPDTRVRYDIHLKRQRAARQREARAKLAAVAKYTVPAAPGYAGAPMFSSGTPADRVAGKVGVVALIGLFGAASLAWQLL